MAVSLSQLRNKKRDEEIKRIFDFLTENGEDVGYASSNTINYPIVLENGNEDFIKIVVSIPTGTRDGTEIYDGYEIREEYKINLAKKAEQKAKQAKKKAEKIAKDKARREAEKKAKEKREKAE